MTEKRTVTLEIAGAKYRMSSDADEDHLVSLADVINERIVALGPKARRTATPAQLLAVVALGLADDLLSAQRRRSEVERVTRDAVESAIAKIDARLQRVNSDSNLRAAVKAEIRKRHRAIRRALPPEARERRSAAICERLQALEEWSGAKTVLAFASMPTEVQTQRAVSAAWRAGKRVGAPAMSASRDELIVREWTADTVLEESGMRFMQPPSSAPAIEVGTIDFVLVPALAIDSRGHRIGFGKGFYDHLLPRLRAVRAGLLFDFERVLEVPNRRGDVPIHILVTDSRTVRFTPSS